MNKIMNNTKTGQKKKENMLTMSYSEKIWIFQKKSMSSFTVT